jgi:hypothetical protein
MHKKKGPIKVTKIYYAHASAASTNETSPVCCTREVSLVTLEPGPLLGELVPLVGESDMVGGTAGLETGLKA